MAEYNPYQPPKAPVAPPPQRMTRFMTAGAAVIGFLIAATYLPALFSLVRAGALHPLAGLCHVLAATLLLVGAALIAVGKRAAVYALGAGLAFAIAGMLFWPSLLTMMLVVLAAIAFGTSLRR